MESMKSYGIVMGDIVHSGQALSVRKLHDQFNFAINCQNFESINIIASPLTITLGDEFQGLVNSLSDAVSIARNLRFKLLLHGINCRFSIGYVLLETKINPDKAWNMMGLGLTRTRQKLNEKQENTLYRFAISDNPVIESLLDGLGIGLSTIEQRWTDLQRHDIIATLLGSSAANIAKQRDVSVHSVYKVRGSGSLDAYLAQWNAVHIALKHLDSVYGMS